MTARTENSLAKLILPNGWVVVEEVPRSAGGTGSNFSVGYVVESAETGQRAFLKALDFRALLSGKGNAIEETREALNIFAFERRLCEACKGLSRVVTILDSGEVKLDPSDPASLVPYLIFETANSGDVRSYLAAATELQVAWVMRSLHHISTGLEQLHGREIAHQDIKPSNVLVFDGTLSKIADLGRASRKSEAGPFDDYQTAGALLYAPPELLYGDLAVEFNERRFACDTYLLGSMLCFFFTGSSMTALWMSKLDKQFRPKAIRGEWEGNFADVLPLVQGAFAESVKEFSDAVPEALRQELTSILTALCDPSPKRRGAPKRPGASYGLEYFISRFNYLATMAEARVKLARP